MKITGIIAEYNPFHNGHLYHLNLARKTTNADYIVVVMSGDYVQRGTPALLDKYTRAEMALKAGADLVLELPCLFSCSSAEFFAEGAVGILHDLGSISSICFGSETAMQDKFDHIAEQFLSETETFKQHLHTLLATGISYPKARSEAFLASLPKSERPIYESILQTPNNILGIEYTKALKRRKSSILPVPITRIHTGYHDTSLPEQGFCSATAIRTMILEQLQTDSSSPLLEQLCNQMPPSAFLLLSQKYKEKRLLFENNFSSLLQYKLLEVDNYSEYADWNEELANRIRSFSSPNQTFSELVSSLKSRQYTQTRIQRALLHLLLDIKNKDLLLSKQYEFHSYAKVLGFKKSSAPLLKQLRITSSIPIIQQLAKGEMLLTPYANSLFQLDKKAHKLYQMLLCQAYSLPYEEELSIKPLILP